MAEITQVPEIAVPPAKAELPAVSAQLTRTEVTPGSADQAMLLLPEPENPGHIEGLRQLDQISPDLLNDYTGEYDAGTITREQLQAWMKDDADRLILFAPADRSDGNTVGGFIYLPDDDPKRYLATLKGVERAKDRILRAFGRRSEILDLSFKTLPDISSQVTRDALSKSLGGVFVRNPDAVVMYYMPGSSTDIPHVTAVGGIRMGDVNYDRPGTPPSGGEKPDHAYRITKNSFEKASSEKARNFLKMKAKRR